LLAITEDKQQDIDIDRFLPILDGARVPLTAQSAVFLIPEGLKSKISLGN